LVLLLAVVLIYWKLTLDGAHVWFDQYDMCQLEIPRLRLLARNLQHAHFPLWDPHVWSGLPVLGSGQPGVVYPLNLPFALLPWSVQSINWLFVAMHFVGSLSFYLLCRDQNLPAVPAILGALGFSCGGYVGSVPWLDIGNGISVTPLVFLFAIRLWTGRKPAESAVLLGLALGVTWLSGHHEIPLIASYAVLFGSLAVAARRLDAGVLGWTALGILLAAAISAVQTIPFAEFGRYAVRWVGAPEAIRWGEQIPYSVHTQYSLPWRGIAGLLLPGTTPEGHTTAFAGVTVIALAALRLAYGWKQPSARIAALLGLGGLAYALGGHTPMHRLLYEFAPMIEKARNPVRGLFLVSLALNLLAAFGANELLTARPHRRRAAAVLVLAVIAIFALVHCLGRSGGTPPASSDYFWEGAVAGAVLLAAASLRNASALLRAGTACALTALVVLELGAVVRLRTTPFDRARTACATALVDHEAMAVRLRREPGLQRVSVERQDAMTCLGDLYGFDQLISFVAAVPANLFRHEFHTPRTQALFGVTHHIGKAPPPGGGTLLASSAGGLNLYRKNSPLPRAWVAHHALPVAGDDALRSAIQDPSIDLRSTVVVMVDVPPLERCGGDDAIAVRYPDTDSVVLGASLACRGMVVLSDLHYPGWRAWLDGRPAPIYEAYGSLRAVFVPAGKHQIRMRYRPASVYTGLALTLIGTVVSLLWLAYARLWRRRPRQP